MGNEQLRMKKFSLAQRVKIIAESGLFGAGAAIKLYAKPQIRYAKDEIQPLMVGGGHMVRDYVRAQVMPVVQGVGNKVGAKANSAARSLVSRVKDSERVHTALAQGARRTFDAAIDFTKTEPGQRAIEYLLATIVRTITDYAQTHPKDIKLLVDRAETASLNALPALVRVGIALLNESSPTIRTDKTNLEPNHAEQVAELKATLAEFARAAAKKAKEEFGKPETRKVIRDAVKIIGDAFDGSSTGEQSSSPHEELIFRRMRKMFKMKENDPQFLGFFYDVLATMLTVYCHINGAAFALYSTYRAKDSDRSNFWQSQDANAKIVAKAIYALSFFS